MTKKRWDELRFRSAKTIHAAVNKKQEENKKTGVWFINKRPDDCTSFGIRQMSDMYWGCRRLPPEKQKHMMTSSCSDRIIVLTSLYSSPMQSMSLTQEHASPRMTGKARGYNDTVTITTRDRFVFTGGFYRFVSVTFHFTHRSQSAHSTGLWEVE